MPPLQSLMQSLTFFLRSTFEPLWRQFNIFSALFLQAWIARESGLRTPWIQSNLFENIQTPELFSTIVDRIPPKFCQKAVWLNKSQLTREICYARTFCSMRDAFKCTLLSQAMLTKRSTRSQGFYLRRIPIGLCHYWKWHQSVDTTNSTVCWQIISCTSCCLWLSFIMQMGNWVYLYDLEELNEVSDPFLSIRFWPSRFLRQSEYDSIDFELIWISKLHFGLNVYEIWVYLRH